MNTTEPMRCGFVSDRSGIQCQERDVEHTTHWARDTEGRIIMKRFHIDDEIDPEDPAYPYAPEGSRS